MAVQGRKWIDRLHHGISSSSINRWQILGSCSAFTVHADLGLNSSAHLDVDH